MCIIHTILRVLNYPIAIHKDPDSDYGVSVPDLPGCFSAGSTLDEALSMAKEAIEFHIEGMLEDGERIPRPQSIEFHAANQDYRGATWALVSIDPTELSDKAVRINITLPERILRNVDRFANKTGETRSGVLAEAVSRYMKAKQPAHMSARKRNARRR